MPVMTRIRRAIDFARFMPPSKLIWRARLTAQRRLALRRPPDLAGPVPARMPAPPMPLFAPRPIEAGRAADGWRFTFLGRAEAVGDPVDWTRPGMGGEHQLWRMNLHYFEYLEAMALDPGLDLIRQWIAANPPFRPGYWHDSWNSYALSLRVVAWMQFLARHDAAPDDVRDALARQLRFLAANLERDLGGNHLIKNIKALAWASAFFAGGEAAAWRATSIALLSREIDAQVLADGVHYERSPSYHAQVLADLIETRHALGGDPLGGRLDAAIAAMVQAAVDLAHPDGQAALFNDAGLTMAYRPAECAGAAGMAAAAQTVFGYRDAGYFGAHLPQFSIIADMGRIGPDDLPAHAHGDIGSFELSVAGERMIVDQGVFEYVAGDRRRRSRAAASHAALALSDAEQAEFFGAFRCGRRPDVAVHRWAPAADGFVLEGRHSGYARLPGRPTPVRRFEVDPDGVRITDRIEGGTDRIASIGLLLHPECSVEVDGNQALVWRGAARIAIRASVPIAVEAAEWWPDMGHAVPTRRIRLTWPAGCVDGDFTIRPISGPMPGQP